MFLQLGMVCCCGSVFQEHVTAFNRADVL